MENERFFHDLLLARGPSGYEQPVQKVYRDFVSTMADEVKTDLHGNVIAHVPGTSDIRMMICGHADEIGMMITYVDDQGFIWFDSIGGIDPGTLPGLRVDVLHDGQITPGIIGRKPVHLQKGSEKDSAPKVENLWIDIGAKDRTEALKKAAPGDTITFQTGFTDLGGGLVASKSLDNRCGVYVAGSVVKALAGEELPVHLFSVASVQEEIGLRGARTAAFGIDPQIAIAIDATFTTDCPQSDKQRQGDVALGKGPVLAVGPMIHAGVLRRLKDVAHNAGIEIQTEVAASHSGTDTDVLQITRAGVATGLVSIPLRYMHSPSEVVCRKDLDHTVHLLAGFIRSLKEPIF